MVGNATNRTNYNEKVCLVKLTDLGSLLWIAEIVANDTFSLYATSIAPVPDGGVMLAGTAGGGRHRGLIMQIDGNGEVEWLKTYSEDQLFFHDILNAGEAGFFLAGQTVNYAYEAATSSYVAKIEEGGQVI